MVKFVSAMCKSVVPLLSTLDSYRLTHRLQLLYLLNPGSCALRCSSLGSHPRTVSTHRCVPCCVLSPISPLHSTFPTCVPFHLYLTLGTFKVGAYAYARGVNRHLTLTFLFRTSRLSALGLRPPPPSSPLYAFGILSGKGPEVVSLHHAPQGCYRSFPGGS